MYEVTECFIYHHAIPTILFQIKKLMSWQKYINGLMLTEFTGATMILILQKNVA